MRTPLLSRPIARRSSDFDSAFRARARLLFPRRDVEVSVADFEPERLDSPGSLG
jgi:hypothetical protein